MTSHKILFSNLGYARGLGGGLVEHALHAYRHLYCSPAVQKKSLNQLSQLIMAESPDLCCFVEIDRGSMGSARFDQLAHLTTEKYPFGDIENKYGPTSILRKLAYTSGKSNAFLARRDYQFEKQYFSCGYKRLIYKISLDNNVRLFFAHFSLNKSTRAQQLLEARELMEREEGETLLLGDFNILTGLQEMRSFLSDGRFILLNDPQIPTFFIHNRKLVLDLCICSKALGANASLKIVPQSYSDHAALVLHLSVQS